MSIQNNLILIVPCGGVGNRLWQIAGLIGLAKILHRTPALYTPPNLPVPRNDVYEIIPPIVNRLKLDCLRELNAPFSYVNNPSYASVDTLMGNKSEQLVLHAYLDDLRFIQDVESEVIDAFQNLHPDRIITDRAAMHVRLTDYKKAGTDPCILTQDYIAKSVSQMMEHGVSRIDLFSDSPEEALEYVGNAIRNIEPGAVVGIAEQSKEYAMKTMACYRYLIAANSTFSWWSAYMHRALNDDQHVVTLPRTWFLPGKDPGTHRYEGVTKGTLYII
ncbi:MAG: hypothetical protein RR382_00270 [Tannerellaceae bacterium]